MLLAIDIGNTNITLGLYRAQEIAFAWRLATANDRMPDEYGLQLLGLLQHAGCAPSVIEAIVLASVVPPLTGTLLQACRKYLDRTPFVVDAGGTTGGRTVGPRRRGSSISMGGGRASSTSGRRPPSMRSPGRGTIWAERSRPGSGSPPRHSSSGLRSSPE